MARLTLSRVSSSSSQEEVLIRPNGISPVSTSTTPAPFSPALAGSSSNEPLSVTNSPLDHDGVAGGVKDGEGVDTSSKEVEDGKEEESSLSPDASSLVEKEKEDTEVEHGKSSDNSSSRLDTNTHTDIVTTPKL
jgi:hypothetical protein